MSSDSMLLPTFGGDAIRQQAPSGKIPRTSQLTGGGSPMNRRSAVRSCQLEPSLHFLDALQQGGNCLEVVRLVIVVQVEVWRASSGISTQAPCTSLAIAAALRLLAGVGHQHQPGGGVSLAQGLGDSGHASDSETATTAGARVA
jgi:hypothetical protein